jgi:hypothetical protein
MELTTTTFVWDFEERGKKETRLLVSSFQKNGTCILVQDVTWD